MRVALVGSVSSSACSLRGLARGGVEICGVLGIPPEHAAGISDYCDLAPVAAEVSAPYQPFARIGEPAVLAFLRRQRPDLLLAIGLSQLLPEEIVALAPAGAVGFHPTPLPRGRGRAPVAWTILLEQPAAANLFFLTSEADAGDIIAQRPVEVRTRDYAQDLIDRTNGVLEEMIVELSPAIRAGRLPRSAQDHAGASWYGKRTPEDGRIDWRRPAGEIDRLIRAVSRPYPGAFTHLRGERLLVWRCEPHARDDHHGTVGQILRTDGRRGALVQCGSGLLWLVEVESPLGDVSAQNMPVGQRLGLNAERELERLADRVRVLEERPRGSAGGGHPPGAGR